MEAVIIKNKFQIDKKYFKTSIYIFAIIGLSIILDKVLSNAGTLLFGTHTIFIGLKKLSSPFVYGFFIAYLVNPIVGVIENKYFIKISGFKKRPRLRRNLAIILTYVLVIGCIAWLMTVFIPEILTNISNFFVILPNNIASLEKSAQLYFDKIKFVNSDDVLTTLNSLFSPLINVTKDIPLMVQKIVNGTVIAASTIINALMGVFIGFYMLSDKEGFSEGIKRIIYAFANETAADKFLVNVKRVNSVFENFIVGKTIDSAIIGVICFIGLTIIKTPFTLLISVIVGITNMIPYFGPFIGAIPAVFIVLLTSPSKAVIVALFILLLQQFDGIILGPKILGVSTGMNPIWIIFSIIVGGAVAGPLGMFLGVPICASVKMFFGEAVTRRYNKKYFSEAPIQSPSDDDTK